MTQPKSPRRSAQSVPFGRGRWVRRLLHRVATLHDGLDRLSLGQAQGPGRGGVREFAGLNPVPLLHLPLPIGRHRHPAGVLGYRHLELYYGVSGSGKVLHTINPRMHPSQVAWVLDHAQDQVVCFGATFLPLVQQVHAQSKVRHWVSARLFSALFKGSDLLLIARFDEARAGYDSEIESYCRSAVAMFMAAHGCNDDRTGGSSAC